VLSLTDAC